ncbi:hypothetical protein PITCH_A1330027 [uncultured Desulfobacterium sp.]|uniref:Transposase DDE domain-containing protein n=1 Tax=uncultured Desulfobacterium sp. TaxID=201089 RepID=A0A445MSC2_9BACT|nr:hypothetical protein PITCH_A1330027 [uncultured Desulfobacterium sp.]
MHSKNFITTQSLDPASSVSLCWIPAFAGMTAIRIFNCRSNNEIDRIAIEGKFGQGKRNYGLGRIMTKLNYTSKDATIAVLLV